MNTTEPTIDEQIQKILQDFMYDATPVNLSYLKGERDATQSIKALISDQVAKAERARLLKLKKMCKRRDTQISDNTYVACVFEAEIDQELATLNGVKNK